MPVSDGRPSQSICQLALMPQREQGHVPLRVDIEHDMARQYDLAQFRHSELSRKLPCLLRLELPPAGSGIEEPGRATACRSKRQQSPSLDQVRLQLLEARWRRVGVLLDHEGASGAQTGQEVRNRPNSGVDGDAHCAGVTPSASSSSSSETNCPASASLRPVMASSASTRLACSASSAW